MEPDYSRAEEEKLIRMICWGGVLSCGLAFLLIAAIAISGVMLAAKSRQPYPADPAAQTAAIRHFSMIGSFHAGMGVGLLLLSFLLVVFSILFALHVVGFEPKHTTFRWAQLIRAAAIALPVIGNIGIGKGYLAGMQKLYYWLVPPAAGFPEGAAVAKGQVVDVSTFTTFITFHSVLLPLLMLVLVVLMWPPFYEFVKPQDSKGARLNTRLKLSGRRNIE